MTVEDRVACRTPNPGKPGQTRIPRWKFDAVRKSILDELAEGPIPFGKLTERVHGRLDNSVREKIGSVGWHVATVKLELEVRGEIRRQEGSKPQVLKLC